MGNKLGKNWWNIAKSQINGIKGRQREMFTRTDTNFSRKRLA